MHVIVNEQSFDISTIYYWITQTELLGFSSFGDPSPLAFAAPSCAFGGTAGGCGATRLVLGRLALARRVDELRFGELFGVRFFTIRTVGSVALAFASRLASDKRSTRFRRPSE